MNKDYVMKSVKFNGVMGLVMKENGFITFVMEMEFLKHKMGKSIEVSGSMICDMVKVNGLNQMVASFMETLGMICAMVCVPINKKEQNSLSLLYIKMV